jgi:hypothetical protein
MKRNPLSSWAFAVLTVAGAAAVAAPPQPHLAVAPNGIKQLRFSWSPVAGATSYELWFQANPSAAESRYFQMPSSQTSVVNNVAVHLLDWGNGRYWLKACDSSGCTSSPRISAVNQQAGVTGVFRNPAQQGATQFGYAVAMSRDGLTFAAVAPFEASSNPDRNAGSVYLYRKSGNSWPLVATLPLEGIQNQGSPSSLSNVRLTLNGAGDVLAVGLPGDEHGNVQGEYQGAVHVYREVPHGLGWRREAIISSFTGFEFSSGDWAQLDDAGDTLAIHAPRARGGALIYTYDQAGSWSHTGTAEGHGIDSDQGTDCGGFSLSGDGNVIVFGCGGYEGERFFETHAAPTWQIRDSFTIPAGATMGTTALDFTGDLLAVRVTSSTGIRVEVRRRVSGAYQVEGVLPEGAWDAGVASPFPYNKDYGHAMQFSDDGKLLAVSDPNDHAPGTGSLAPPLTAGTEPTGAVYIWERRTAGWVLRRVVKPGRSGAGYAGNEFGVSLGLGDKGRTLVVGHPHANTSAGIVWMY